MLPQIVEVVVVGHHHELYEFECVNGTGKQKNLAAFTKICKHDP